MTTPELGDEFARETGDLTAHRWRVGLALYLAFAIVGTLVEWRVYPQRGPLLALALLAQAATIAVAWFALQGVAHPRSAWTVLGCNFVVGSVIAVYNARVGGDMLYVLITYLGLMLVTAMFIPWGARFQLGLNSGVIVLYGLAVAGGGRVGPVPAYDYSAIAAITVFSSLGALYIDQYRRELFAQATALREANRSLEAANRARTELLSGLSHDMRTPIAIVMGYADLLNDDPALAEALRQPVRSIGREAQELLYLVDSVFDLARLEAGQIPFHRSTVQLAELLAPLRETTEDLLRDRGVRVRWEIPSGLTIDGDAGKVREIVRNLLSNAVKYTQEGEIRLSAVAADAGVELAVTDTGVGIATEHLDMIFDPFSQIADGGRRPQGSGFGLYMVKLLVELVGGRVNVQSVPGQGSTFRIWLPLHPPTASSDLESKP